MASSRKLASASVTGRLEAHVANAVATHIAPGTVVTAAFSGGMDSVVMLELLRRAASTYGIELRALHVNHGLSLHADAWERFCRSHCARRRIHFLAVRVLVQGAGANVEAQARTARYHAFAQAGSAVVALAHHRDDQAETLLLNLLRGAGVEGLAAMPALRALAAGGDGKDRGTVRLIRPLLEIARSDIARYAVLRRLRWIDDESNRSERFARNFLRLRALPLLERRFPAARATLARAAAHLREAATLLDELAHADLGAVGGSRGRLHVQRLAALGEPRAANAMRHFLASHGERPPSLARTRDILWQLTRSRGDAQPSVDLQRYSVRRFRGWIELVALSPVDREDVLVCWNGERLVHLADGGELTASKGSGRGVSLMRLQAAPVTVRRRRGGERLRIARAGRTRTLKNLLQEAGVAPWLRTRMPLVYCGEKLVWGPFVGIAADFQARPGEPAWCFRWRPAGAREVFR